MVRQYSSYSGALTLMVITTIWRMVSDNGRNGPNGLSWYFSATLCGDSFSPQCIGSFSCFCHRHRYSLWMDTLCHHHHRRHRHHPWVIMMPVGVIMMHPQIKRNATRINIIKSAKWEGCERYLNAIILKCFKSCYLKRRFANVEYISVSTIDLLGHLILIKKVTKPRSKIFNTGGEIARLSQQL